MEQQQKNVGRTAVAALALAALLSACATCERHPTACAAVTIVAVGSVALIAGSHHRDSTRAHDVTLPGLDCQRMDCR